MKGDVYVFACTYITLRVISFVRGQVASLADSSSFRFRFVSLILHLLFVSSRAA